MTGANRAAGADPTPGAGTGAHLAHVDAARAAAIAREHWGIAAEARPLAGELDLNFALDGPDGRHVLKLYARGAAPADLDLQDAALDLLAGEPLAPRLVRTTAGAPRADAGGTPARILTWLPGRPWAELASHDEAALASLGRAVARVDRALAPLAHPALAGRRRWNMVAATDLRADAAGDPLAAAALARFAGAVLPRLLELPAQAIHNDANENNVLVGDDGAVCGLIDLGDVCSAPRVCGLAVACAYAMALLPAPGRQVAAIAAGYHEVAPLAPRELALLPDLIRVRLAMSIAMATRQRREQPANDYLLISQDVVPALLRRLGPQPRELELLRLRAACGYEAVAHAHAVRAHLARIAAGPVCRPGLADAPVLDWSAGAARAGEPPAATPALGRYLEDRRVYDTDAFAGELDGERRTLHLGVDVFLDPGEPVLAPLDGVVRASAYRPAARDYGGVVLLDHETADGTPFHTLYGHLAPDGLAAAGTRIGRGERVGLIGAEHENGGWAPHLHLQLLTTELGEGCAVHGVGTLAERDLWESVAPDPNLLLGLPGGCRAEPG